MSTRSWRRSPRRSSMIRCGGRHFRDAGPARGAGRADVAAVRHVLDALSVDAGHRPSASRRRCGSRPAAAELTPAEEADFEVFMTGVAGAEITDGILRDLRGIRRAPTRIEPHYYLSLFAHPRSRTAARVSAWSCCRASLARIDAAGMPAYLESTQSGEPEAVRERRLRAERSTACTVPSGCGGNARCGGRRRVIADSSGPSCGWDGDR